jgi:hypothetical protein
MSEFIRVVAAVVVHGSEASRWRKFASMRVDAEEIDLDFAIKVFLCLHAEGSSVESDCSRVW